MYRILHFKKPRFNKIFCFKCGYISNSAYSLNKYFNDSYVKSLFAVRFTRKLLKIIYKLPITVVVLNNFQKEILKSYKKDIKVEILSNPIKHKGNNRNQYKSSSNFVVYAGTLTNEKGVDKLLETWRESNINKLILKIIGTGPMEDELKEKFKENNIKFFGFLDNKKTLDHIREARAVVTATRMFEGQPRLLCEATSFGVPSIYPYFGGMSEYFPKDYEFSFKQYDYKDLQSKFLLLDNEIKLNENSDSVYNFFSNYLSEDIYLEKFKKLIFYEKYLHSIEIMISVIMSTYNDQDFVHLSIESILKQSYTDFEFLIVDDFSSDSTLKVLKEYELIDERIKVFRNSKNIGLTKSLNKLIKLSNNKYIARQDSDDISLPNRFKIQLDYMNLKKYLLALRWQS